MDVRFGSKFVADVDAVEKELSKLAVVKTPEDSFPHFGNKNSNGYEGSEETKPCKPNLSSKGLDKSATFPCSSKELHGTTCLDEEGEDEPETALQVLFFEEHSQSPYARSLSFPLVSAMKGSREKQGISPRRLNVKWAPDVYDPIPTSVSHSVKSKQKKSKDRDNNNKKKKGKKWQKGNPPRGKGVKEKKQQTKFGGQSEKGHKTPGPHASDDFDSYDIGNQDNCGSSFLKESVNMFHYATEAS